MNETVLYVVDGPIATITLNRPDRLNAMNLEMLAEMLEAVETAASDTSVTAVILTGAGRAFTAGGDMKLLSQGGVAAAGINRADVPFEHAVANLRANGRGSQLLREMPKLTIAAVNGPCAGAGMGWACACDIRYASDSAVFNTAFLNAGVSGDLGLHWTLPRIVGPAKARELYLLPDRIDAAEALRIGLVSKVVPGDELMPLARAAAERTKGFAPLALQAMKANQNDAMDLPFGEFLDRESTRHVRTGLTDDAKEAAMSFLEKRPPVFKGR